MLNTDQLTADISSTLATVDIPELGDKIRGKVRDIYKVDDDTRLLIATDRVSAFDSILGLIPHRGQVLNQLAAWWFDKTADIVPNHLIEVIDPNVSLVREAETIPIEVVVRGYITGVTDTSMWTLYANGDRQPYGIPLPDGLNKNDPLPEDVITPTTKAATGHDERITAGEIVARGIVPAALWAQIEETATRLYQLGKRVAREHGLILVDTKYEFGLIDGQLTLIDEVHTPDSSRYWLASSHANGNPQHVDKEFMRLWFRDQGYRGQGTPPTLPDGVVASIAARYISVYERLTGNRFQPAAQPADERIRQAVLAYFRG